MAEARSAFDEFDDICDEDLREIADEILPSLETNTPNVEQLLVEQSPLNGRSTTDLTTPASKGAGHPATPHDNLVNMPVAASKPMSVDTNLSQVKHECKMASQLEQYVFDFGSHKSHTLNEVMHSHACYIPWLIENEIYGSYPDLEAALRKAEYLTEPPRHLHIDQKLLSTWKNPHRPDPQDTRFYHESPRRLRVIIHKWAVKYFGVSSNLLKAAGVGSLNYTYHKTWFLYEIYACAEHFGTIPEGNAEEALGALLRRRNH